MNSVTKDAEISDLNEKEDLTCENVGPIVDKLIKTQNIEKLQILHDNNLISDDKYSSMFCLGIFAKATKVLNWLLADIPFYKTYNNPKLLLTAIRCGEYESARLLMQHGWTVGTNDVISWMQDRYDDGDRTQYYGLAELIKFGIPMTEEIQELMAKKKDILAIDELIKFGIPVSEKIQEMMLENCSVSSLEELIDEYCPLGDKVKEIVLKKIASH